MGAEPVTRHTLDPMAREADQLADQDRQVREAIAAAAAEWKLKWPHHCTACAGWGGSTFYQSHPYGSTTASETLFEPCDAQELTTCHRCGAEGMTEDADPDACKFCGWKFGCGGEPHL